MKYTNLRAFEKHVEGAAPNHFAEVYMILAKEAFLRKGAIDCLVKTVLKGEKSPELCLQVYDGEKHSAAMILSELETMGFFGSKRLIVVHNVDAFDKATTAKFESYFATSNRSICLALAASSINRATNFYKKAEKIGVVLDIEEQKPWEKEKSLTEWLFTTSKSEGKQIDYPTCQRLIKQLGTDQSILYQELLKLVCYVGERPIITQDDVFCVTGSFNNETAWQLGEAIFCRNPASALRISKALLDDGVALIALLRQIRSQFQTKFHIATLLAQGGTGADIAREYSYMKGQILERHIEQAKNYGLSRFKEGLLRIDHAELQAKSSLSAPYFLIEMLIIKLSAA